MWWSYRLPTKARFFELVYQLCVDEGNGRREREIADVSSVSPSSELPVFINERGRQNEDTLWRPRCWRDHVSQMLTRFATRATFVADTNFVPWTQNVLKIFRNISCARAARNNVAAFWHGRATSQDTMLPPQCVLVLPGLKFNPAFRLREARPRLSRPSRDLCLLQAREGVVVAGEGLRVPTARDQRRTELDWVAQPPWLRKGLYCRCFSYQRVSSTAPTCRKTLVQLRYSTVFTRISAAALIQFSAIRVRRLFEGGAYLKSNWFLMNMWKKDRIM